MVVVGPKVDDDAAFRVESAEDTDSDAHNMRQVGGREREGRPQQHWHWDLLQRYLLQSQRQPPPQ